MALLALLLFLPIGLVIKYNSSLTVYAKFLFIKFPILPGKKKKIRLSDYSPKKMAKDKKKQQKKLAKKEAKKQKKLQKNQGTGTEKKKRTFSDITELLDIICDILRSFTDKFSDRLKIKLVNIDITVGSDDSAKTALLFGGANMAIQTLLPILSSFKKYDECDIKNIRVRADFLADKTVSDIHIKFATNLFGVIASAIHSSSHIKRLFDKL